MLLDSAFGGAGRTPAPQQSEYVALAVLATHAFAAWTEGGVIDAPIPLGAEPPADAPTHAFAPLVLIALRRMRDGRADDEAERVAVLEIMIRAGEELYLLAVPEVTTVFFASLLARCRGHGAERRLTAQCMHRIAQSLIREGRLDDALAVTRLLELLSHGAGLEDYAVWTLYLMHDLNARWGDLHASQSFARRAHAAAVAYGLADHAALTAGVIGIALHLMGRNREAVPFLMEGATLADPWLRASHLMGLGVLLMLLGHRRASRDALEAAEALTPDMLHRSRTRLNLMRLAADSGDRAAFDRWRQRLFAGFIDPSMAPAAYCMLGEAYHLFGERESARASFAQAIALGEQHRIAQWIFIAERGLAELDAGTPPAVVPEPPVTDDVAPALAYVRTLRAAMGERRD
jgi:tetratricopeptide (TPR) repeat protein